MTIKPATELPPFSKRACKCMTCGSVFTAVGNFDAHRKSGKCVPPDTVGLIVNKNGLWALPADENGHFSKAK